MAKRKTPEATTPAWTYPVDEGEVGSNLLRQKIAANEAECKAVAKLLNIPAIHSLSAEMTLTRAPGNKAVVHVEGTLKAGVTQSCIVTGAPVKSHLEEDFEAWYADPASFTSLAKVRREKGAKGSDAEVPVMEEREDPEPIVNGKIDLGDLVTQYLSLSLDPYPRVPGAVFAEGGGAQEAEEPSALRKNPFDVLKDWK